MKFKQDILYCYNCKLYKEKNFHEDTHRELGKKEL